MQPRSLEDRVTLLEKNLQGLPERVGALDTRVTELTVQFVQFRDEVRIELSAVRKEMREGHEELKGSMREGDEETRRFMRVLHEDLVARITLLKNG